MEGKIYILTNRAFPGLIKIGHTTRDVKKRVNELNTTGVPSPFSLLLEWEVNDSQQIEKSIHDKFSQYRNTSDREFFNIECLGSVVQYIEILKAENLSYLNDYESSKIKDVNFFHKSIDHIFRELNTYEYFQKINDINLKYQNSIELPDRNSRSNYLIFNLLNYWKKRSDHYSKPRYFSASRSKICNMISELYKELKFFSYDLDGFDREFNKYGNSNSIEVYYKIHEDDSLVGEWIPGKTHAKVCELSTKASIDHPERCCLDLLHSYKCLTGGNFDNYINNNMSKAYCREIKEGDILKVGNFYFATLFTKDIPEGHITGDPKEKSLSKYL